MKMNQLTLKEKRKWSVVLKIFANPLTSMNDQNRVSPYNIASWSNTKFSKLTSQELYGRQ